MTSFCQPCFGSRQTQVDEALTKATSKYEIFWLGYVVCNPLPEGREKKSTYDVDVEQVKRMRLEGVPVVFNHNKHRKPLGHVAFSWHDHDFPNLSAFAVAFVAGLDSRHLLETPAVVTLLGDNFASLSTLRDEPHVPVEISITYCGARDGCFGMFLSGRRLRDLCPLLGLGERVGRRSHKRVGATLDASHHRHMTRMPTAEETTDTRAAVVGDAETDKLAAALGELSREQFDAVQKAMSDNQKAVESMCMQLKEARDDSDRLRDAVGHLSDYVSSMIQSRLSLERNSESEMAKKRRRDFQAMKDRGIFSRECSDMEAIREMITYCREAFEDSSEADKSVALGIIEKFQEKFPHLGPKLECSRRSPLETVDAAFQLINDHMHQQTVDRLVGSQRQALAKARALEAARHQWESMGEKKLPPHQVPIDASAVGGETKARAETMDFAAFAKRAGVAGSLSDDDEPSRKRRRKGEGFPWEEPESADAQEFMEFAMQQEKKRERFIQYKKEFDKKKRETEKKRAQDLEQISSALPSLLKLAERWERSEAQRSTASRDVSASGAKKTGASTSSPGDSQAPTIDASKVAETTEAEVLFDL